MIEPKHRKVNKWLLNIYINHILKSDFSEVRITGSVKPDDRPLLLVPNHFSWWDGFFMWYLNQKVFNKQFHIMMLESELRKHMFFAKVGAFSISPNTRSIVQSINFCQQVLNQSNNMLVMYPQGELQSQHHSDVVFRRGIERILARTSSVQIVFAACLTDYFTKRRPYLTIALKEYNGEISISSIEDAYNNHLFECKMNQNKLYPR
ncbi:MAG: lysophospholipid acyltransferase family protein [Bacteroidales bacterium]|nr:lysophospholipid acyltransferase family protein [Bacteroidales bacterium]